MIRNLFLTIILVFGLFTSTVAQTDQRSRETKIADIVMLLPAQNTANHNNLMEQLYLLGNVINDLSKNLADPGGNDAQIRFAISGLTMHASKNTAKRAAVAKNLCEVIPTAKSDEIRDFLFIQLQYVASEESIETASKYLGNARLSDAAARVLVLIGGDKAGTVLFNALKSANAAQKNTLIQSLGYLAYTPAVSEITSSLSNASLKKTSLFALSTIAATESEKALSDAAESVGYKYEPNDALKSYLLYLQNRIAKDKAQVAAASKKMLKATNEKTQIAAKTAALELLSQTGDKQATKEIIAALGSPCKQYRLAALNFSSNINSETMWAELLKKAKKEKQPEVKAEIIAKLGAIKYAPASSFISENLANSNVAIKNAAIVASGNIGGESAINSIITAMNTNDAAVILAGKNTLKTINSNKLVAAIATALPKASNEAKVAFLDILSSREAKDQSEVVYEQTASENADVRMAAYKALKSVASENDATHIARLLNTSTDKNETTALQEALYSSVSGMSKDDQTKRVIGLLKTGRNLAVYYNVLAKIGGQDALKMVLSGMQENDSKLNEAAFEALTNWSDASAMPALFDIAKSNPKYADKALISYISKVTAARNKPEQKLLQLRNALEIAKTAEQKQGILRQISGTGTFVGLLTAGNYLDDKDSKVQQAAVQAVRSIALAHPEYYGTTVTALLNKAIAVNKDPEAEYQKQAILKHISGLPKDEGFVSMFNETDLTGWKGLVENPIARGKMTAKQFADKQKKADEIMRRDWHVENGVLVFDGPGYDNLCSEKMYGDFEMYVDWKIAPKGDAGIYVRGTPQVQIWDISLTEVGAQVGSGGLYNNQKHASKPLMVADNYVNEWNSFYIKMVGEKITVYLNGQLVTDNVTLENYWDRKSTIFPKEAIELQAHGTRVEYRDIYVREIARPDPYEVSAAEKKEGFVPMFNGIDMSGWVGNLKDYIPVDGTIVCDPTKGGRGNLYTAKEYSDFVMRFDFMLTPAANNGLGIRTPMKGDAAYVGMELQILDNEADVYKDLEIYQYHGSVYGVLTAKRGYLKPVGEWNTQEVIANGSKIKVILNGTVILDGDIAEASNNYTKTVDGKDHPGLLNKSGHIAFLGHGSELTFKNIRIKELIKK